MTIDPITLRAASVVDALRSAAPDWRQVSQHLAALPPEAGPLARALGAGRFIESVARYDHLSSAAEGARDRLKLHANRAAVGGFLVAALGGVQLYLDAAPASGIVPFVIAALQVACVVLALWSAVVITFRRPQADWSRHRSEAEHQRLAHFKSLLSAEAEPRPGELPLPPLALEYARAYLLDDQLRWFRRRARDFAPTVRRIKRARILAMLLIAAATLPTILALVRAPEVAGALPALAAWGEWLRQRLDIDLALLAGVVGGALQTLVTTFAATSLASRNAETYERMAQRLAALAGAPLEHARKDAAAGRPATTSALWAELVFELSAEHREWSAAHRTAQLIVLDRSSGGSLGSA